MKTYPDGSFEVDVILPLDALADEMGVFEFKPVPKLMPGERYRLQQEDDVMVLYTANGMVVATSEPLAAKQ